MASVHNPVFCVSLVLLEHRLRRGFESHLTYHQEVLRGQRCTSTTPPS